MSLLKGKHCVGAAIALSALAATLASSTTQAHAAVRSGLLVRFANQPGFQVRDGNGRLVTRLSTGRITPKTAAADSPDGRWIAFVGDDRYLWVVGSDGRRRRRLTRAEPTTPVWSPDGSRLAIQASDGKAAFVGWPSARAVETQLPGYKGLAFSPDGWLWAADGDILSHIQFQGVSPGGGAKQAWGQPAPDDLWAGSADAVAISPAGRTAWYLRYEGTGSVREALYQQPRGGSQRAVLVGPDLSHVAGALACLRMVD
jgi:dipeptidyl aminopeptidase/acylaminoacyl peptidase